MKKKLSKFANEFIQDLIINSNTNISNIFKIIFVKLYLYKYNKYYNYISWDSIIENEYLSEKFLNIFKKHYDEDQILDILSNQKLSENYLNNFLIDLYKKKNTTDFKTKCISKILQYQKLSQNFIQQNIEKFCDISINRIALVQNHQLSEYLLQVILDCHESDYLITCICKHQKLSDEFIYKNKLSDIIKSNTNNWLYKDFEFKLNQIKSTGLYEIVNDEYIIAYKGIRKDRYSNYNFQYQYLPGCIYECFADHNADHQNSFGLSVWTEKYAKNYCDQLVVKVKVNINDIAAIVHDSNKLRCTKIEILN